MPSEQRLWRDYRRTRPTFEWTLVRGSGAASGRARAARRAGGGRTRDVHDEPRGRAGGGSQRAAERSALAPRARQRIVAGGESRRRSTRGTRLRSSAATGSPLVRRAAARQREATRRRVNAPRAAQLRHRRPRGARGAASRGTRAASAARHEQIGARAGGGGATPRAWPRARRRARRRSLRRHAAPSAWQPDWRRVDPHDRCRRPTWRGPASYAVVWRAPVAATSRRRTAARHGACLGEQASRGARRAGCAQAHTRRFTVRGPGADDYTRRAAPRRARASCARACGARRDQRAPRTGLAIDVVAAGGAIFEQLRLEQHREYWPNRTRCAAAPGRRARGPSVRDAAADRPPTGKPRVPSSAQRQVGVPGSAAVRRDEAASPEPGEARAPRPTALAARAAASVPSRSSRRDARRVHRRARVVRRWSARRTRGGARAFERAGASFALVGRRAGARARFLSAAAGGVPPRAAAQQPARCRRFAYETRLGQSSFRTSSAHARTARRSTRAGPCARRLVRAALRLPSSS